MFVWVYVSSLLAFGSPGAGPSLTRDRFVDQFAAAAPKVFCEKESYFRKCFNVTEEACKKAADQEVRKCLTALSPTMPIQLNQPTDGRAWGEKVGSCAGAQFELALQSQRQSSTACNDAAQWSKPKK
jgi:hypothetical protein